MKGGQHAFDLVPTWRTVPVVEAVERFFATTVAAPAGEAAPERELEEELTEPAQSALSRPSARDFSFRDRRAGGGSLPRR